MRGPPRIPQPHGSRPPQAHASPPWATPQQPNRTNPTASARANRNYLRALYSTLKYCDQHIRFSFITGVSKFSKVSLFSSLNNLNDLTLDPRYSSICGYTDHHLDTVFAPELPGLDRDRIREWYNGYSWGGDERLYNPYDVLLLFDQREFLAWGSRQNKFTV